VKKVVLIYPPVTNEERYGSKLGESCGIFVPLGVFYVASYLQREGYRVRVFDGEALNADLDGLCRDALNCFEPDELCCIGISATTMAFHRALSVARKLKELRPGCVVILGGIHVTANASDALSFTAFDYGVIGEGEVTAHRLLECLYSGGDPSQVQGIAYRGASGEVIRTPPRALIEDLDTLPFPAYDLVEDFSLYSPRVFEHHEKPVVTFISSRGCPGQCTFCDCSVFGRRYRQRSAENVVAELKYLYERYHFKSVSFYDDTFLLDKARIREIFNRLAQENIRFKWFCLSHVNHVDEDFLRFIRDNGCHSIHFGVESGDPEILKIIKKGISLEKALEVFRICRKIGLPSTGLFMIGHPGETVESINRTIRFACRSKLDQVLITINTPFPGSPQYAEAERYGTFAKTDWSRFTQQRPVFVPFGLTEKIMLRKRKEFALRFYLRPDRALKYIGTFFRPGGWGMLKKTFKAALFIFERPPARSAQAPGCYEDKV